MMENEIKQTGSEVEKLIKIYQELEKTGLMVTAGKKSAAQLMVSHDVIPVVRCKKCKHLHLQDENDDRGDCDIHEEWTTRTMSSFCSYGEERETIP